MARRTRRLRRLSRICFPRSHLSLIGAIPPQFFFCASFEHDWITRGMKISKHTFPMTTDRDAKRICTKAGAIGTPCGRCVIIGNVGGIQQRRLHTSRTRKSGCLRVRWDAGHVRLNGVFRLIAAPSVCKRGGYTRIQLAQANEKKTNEHTSPREHHTSHRGSRNNRS